MLLFLSGLSLWLLTLSGKSLAISGIYSVSIDMEMEANIDGLNVCYLRQQVVWQAARPVRAAKGGSTSMVQAYS
jgi:hypothetical protein